ncbi:MAG: DsbA family protein [Gemmatimonadota bacterium]
MSSSKKRKNDAGAADMTKFYWILGIVAVIGVAAVGYSVGSNRLGTAATEPVEVEGLDNMETLVDLAQGVTKGDPDAPVTIVEFGDYQCPGCGAFALQVKPQVELNYVQTGKARFIFYDFPLISIHPHAFLAARAARCAGDQGKFWEYHDLLFRNQSTWAAQQSVMGTYLGYADDLGMDRDAFEACLKSDAYADVVSANMRLGYELGVDGTPTVMISEGRGMAQRLRNFDFASIQRVVEDLLAEKDAGEGASN